MKAIVHEEYGGSEVLRLAEVDEPHVGPDLVRTPRTVAGLVTSAGGVPVSGQWLRNHCRFERV
ncbi:hypothetical protein OIE52_44215 [Streptomyces canus]|uniref:hypothetical protein n=1 Tax=Streptomyces canus TaxID=58343 RepID=UPI002E27AEB9|nr:hypothetical protein [Streptomyces canus]